MASYNQQLFLPFLIPLLIFFVKAHIYDFNYPNYYYPPVNHQHNFPNSFYTPQITPQVQNNFLLSPFLLPRQVRVPGRIEIIINGNTAEILCEFPRFLILIQKLHWHHRYDDPYGTYYDTNQNFAPRIQVLNDGKYKSILRIQGYNEDDFGHWRCLSSGVLPEESQNIHPGDGYFGNYLRKIRRKRSYYSSTVVPPQKGLFAPFYRPSYGLFGVFQEIKFVGGGGQQGNTSNGHGQQLQLVRANNNSTV